MQLLSNRLRGPESHFSIYISNLPVGFSGIPMFFPKEAIMAIEYPPVSEQVKKRCKWLYDFSTKELANLPGSPDDPFGGLKIDINAMGWAMASITSRAFRTKGPQHPASCLPLIGDIWTLVVFVWSRRNFDSFAPMHLSRYGQSLIQSQC